MDSNILIYIAAVVAGILISRYMGGVKKASPEQVREKIAAGARILDVRTTSEFASGSYKKAKNFPVETLENRLFELEPKDKPIVVFCASGSRSGKAWRILKKAGFTDITNAGGLSDMP
jgi:phage shock protein E